jgi:LacI family transcriptional regulator
MKLLIDHLMKLGHKRFVFIHGGWYGDIHERRDIFLKYMKKAEGDLEYSWIQATENNAAGGYSAMMQVSEMSPFPTAVMASDDALATGILKAANDLKLSVPGDVSITGFDDIDCAKYTFPSLTTVKQPFEQMSDIALELLLMQMEGKKIPEEKLYREIQPELIIRDSSGPCKKK